MDSSHDNCMAWKCVIFGEAFDWLRRGALTSSSTEALPVQVFQLLGTTSTLWVALKISIGPLILRMLQ